MNKERAAQIWSVLERALIERCGLGDGRMLEVNRPYMIRVIGDALTIEPVDTTKEEAHVEQPVVASTRDRYRDVPVQAQLLPRLDDSAPVRAIRDEMMLNKRIDEALAKMLEASCLRRVGYSGDDSVGYE